MSVESETTPSKDVASAAGETVSPAPASSPTEPIAPAQSLEQSHATPPTPTGNSAPADGAAPAERSATTEAPAAKSPADASQDNACQDSAAAATASADGAVQTPEEAKPSKRIQIGSQRGGDAAEAKPKPVTPVSEGTPQPVQQRKNYPPPNVRDKLSPEMEAELEAALGGDSVDSILGDAANDATTELAAGTKVKGQVAKIHGEDIFLEVPGTRHQGVIPVKQFEKKELPEVGAQLEATVSKFDAEQGLYEMSLSTAAIDVGNWDEVSEGQIVEVMVDKANKGGLECKVSGIRGFIPMGQISIYRIENAEDYVGQKLACVITEVSRKRKNLVLSHRALMERERKENREKLMAELAPGQLREGIVRSLQDFGAFVDLGGADGLVHISQLSWDRIGHPSEVVQVGEKIKVKVEKVNQESGKIALSYREAGDNPWKDADSNYPSGSKAKGTVTKLMQFGAFVKLQPGVEGLIHISELGHGRVHRTSDVLSEGQDVEVQVLTVDTDAQKIGLSLKALMPKPEKPKSEKEQQIEAAIDKADEQPKRKRKHDPNLKGGIGGPSGGEQFGLKW